ncbi:regulator of nonsense transcripts 3A isoform X2 [Orussus abietinus]|uniref:regulator of nonsense transcripts 3A isoform X2 n=1 Tax=Orussus abietinus TaxID=222816 RepID=UPI0006267BF9|nr:regulator of nonsense transcripts 3A isoform X2 [Orussus abietinus]
MTEETQQPEAPAQTESHSINPDAAKLRDKKEKCRPMTKVVVRRLPPSMTQDQFLEQISPLPEHDYLYFVKADMSMGQFAFSRAYINFVEQQDIFIFREKFDNYVFVDGKGTEYPAVVEFAPFQRLPKKRVGKKKDLKCGTIESDPYYVSFLESLKNQEADSGVSQPKTEYSYQPPDNTPKKVTSTPLLEYLKQRKQEKQRLRDEKREERRRRDMERRRAKEEPTISKVLKNPDQEKDTSMKESKEDKDEKVSPKDTKIRNKREDKVREKLPRDRDIKPLVKGYRERDDRNKEREMKQHRKHDEKKPYGRKEERDNLRDDRKMELKEERKVEPKDENKEFKERRVEEKREGNNGTKPKKDDRDLVQRKEKKVEVVPVPKRVEKCQVTKDDVKKSNDKSRVKAEDDDVEPGEDSMREEQVETDEAIKEPNARDTDALTGTQEEGESSEVAKSRSIEEIDKETSNDGRDAMIDVKITKRRSSLESGGEGGGGDGGCLRRHKSLDGGDQNNLKKNESDDKEKDKKDPRLERRIRNKDRPAMEIYRPGMGKFSKQRLEREKSSNDERASLSQSPTPSSATSNASKTGKSNTEVRSMTFKRSVSRDLP